MIRPVTAVVILVILFLVDRSSRANYITLFPESQPGAARRFIPSGATFPTLRMMSYHEPARSLRDTKDHETVAWSSAWWPPFHIDRRLQVEVGRGAVARYVVSRKDLPAFRLVDLYRAIDACLAAVDNVRCIESDKLAFAARDISLYSSSLGDLLDRMDGLRPSDDVG